MGLLYWKDEFLAVQKVGRVAGQWAIVDAIEHYAFERDVDNVFDFRSIKARGYLSLRLKISNKE